MNPSTVSPVAVQPDGTLSIPESVGVLDFRTAKRRFNPLLRGVMIAMLGVFIFASIDTYHCTELTEKLNSKLLHGIPFTAGYFSYFDLLVIGLSLLLLERFGFQLFKVRPILRVVFLFAFACFVLDFINPNDNSPLLLGLPISNNIPAMVYLLFMFTVFFLREEGFLLFLRSAFTMASFIVIFRTVLLLALWAMGKGNYAFGAGSTLTEGDSLVIFSFFNVLFLILYFARQRLIFLAMWAATAVLQILSFRRSATFILLGADAFVLLLYLLLKARLGAILRNIAVVAFLLAAGALVVIEAVPEDTVQYYVNRYFGMFIGMGQSQGARDQYAGDSGHFDESAATMAYAFAKMDFWGYGAGKEDRINIPGATSRLWVHNVYAASWLYHGVYQFLFYAFMGFLVLLLVLKVFYQRKRYDRRFVILLGGMLAFMIMMMVVWYSNPIQIAEALRIRILWATILACLFRITPSNSSVLFDGIPVAGSPPLADTPPPVEEAGQQS